MVCKNKADFKKKLLFCGSTGLFLGLSNVFRPEEIIGILAIAVWFIYIFIINVNKKNALNLLLFVVLEAIATYAVYKLVNFGVGQIIIHSGISPNGINNGCIFWSIVCGLTPDSYGGYSTKYMYILNYDGFQEQFEVFKKIMNEIFGNRGIGDIIKFFTIKEYRMWGELYYLTVTDNMPNNINLLFT